MATSKTPPPSLRLELQQLLDTAINEGRSFAEVRAMYDALKAADAVSQEASGTHAVSE